MKFLTPLFLCAIFLLAAYGLMRLTLAISSLITRRRILADGKATVDTACALLATYFGTSNIIAEKSLPCRTASGTFYTKVDCILILKGRIVVIEIKTLSGTIYPSVSDTWHAVTAPGREQNFPSPLLQNEHHVNALIGILEKEHITPQPTVSGMVIFTSARARFVGERNSSVFTLPDAVKKLQALNRQERFSLKETVSLHRAIRKHAKSPRNMPSKASPTHSDTPPRKPQMTQQRPQSPVRHSTRNGSGRRRN